jgi:DNA-binding NarL/FixJ family response regulator
MNELASTSAVLFEEAEYRAQQKATRVARVLELSRKGYGPQLIATRLGLSRTAVTKYLRLGGVAPMPPGARCDAEA